MKRLVICAALLFPILARADGLPERKAGLWEITITSTGAKNTKMTMKQCTDSKTEAKMLYTGKEMEARAGAVCKTKEIHREGDKYVGGSECDIKGTKVVSQSVFTGDFQNEYSGEAVVTYDPPMAGMKETRATYGAKYLGACEKDQEPGDIVLPNGMKMNVNKMKPLPQAPATK